ncbi:ankyrin repeat-containing protein [Senna tora]|uniref:Ankyrin repeat-containing protein n=1 Tax=Senna tora TaxID=362788 RepID=A0A834T073_9FABA|nr:ankyrin repeat-containing protein [Senna tora]
MESAESLVLGSEMYNAVSNRVWWDVTEIYQTSPEIRAAKMTKSEDTALHVAITHAPPYFVLKLLDVISHITQTAIQTLKVVRPGEGTRSGVENDAVVLDCIIQGLNGMRILAARNKRGDTPLHCAASLGSLPICQAITRAADKCKRLKHKADDWLSQHDDLKRQHRHGETMNRLHKWYTTSSSLVAKRNEEGETPLFLAALNAHKDTFLFLHSVYFREHINTSTSTMAASLPKLFTKNGGDTILHATLHRQYFAIHVDKLEVVELDDKLSVVEVDSSDSESETLVQIPLQFLKDYPTLEETSDAPGSLRKIKQKHVWGEQIMKELLKPSAYYEHNETETDHLELEDNYKQKTAAISDGKKKEVNDNNNITTDQSKTKDNEEHYKVEVVKEILRTYPGAIQDKTTKKMNIVHVAIQERQTHILELLLAHPLWLNLREAVDVDGNNALHFAAKLSIRTPWETRGPAMHLQWEVKWLRFVEEIMPSYLNSQKNSKGMSPGEVFAKEHKDVVKESNEWLKDTCTAYTIVATLIASMTFSACYQLPGGSNERGKPTLEGQTTFDTYMMAILVAFLSSVTSLVVFIALYSSRMQPIDYLWNLPLKLVFGLTSLFVSIMSTLLSFSAAHSLALESINMHRLRSLYVLALLPLCLYALPQIPLYWLLLRASFRRIPLPKYLVCEKERNGGHPGERSTGRRQKIPEGTVREDTPLHCAASRGSRRICERIVLLDASLEIGDALVRMLNKEGESPLFLAALHGHKNTFLYLHAVCTKGGYMNSGLWTKHGGDTILHFTIQRQYFDQQLASKVNDEGVTHLQVLASIPTAFKSGTRLRWREKFLYTYDSRVRGEQSHVSIDNRHKIRSDRAGGENLGVFSCGDSRQNQRQQQERCTRGGRKQAASYIGVTDEQLALA